MNQYFAISNYVDCLTHLLDVHPYHFVDANTDNEEPRKRLMKALELCEQISSQKKTKVEEANNTSEIWSVRKLRDYVRNKYLH